MVAKKLGFYDWSFKRPREWRFQHINLVSADRSSVLRFNLTTIEKMQYALGPERQEESDFHPINIFHSDLLPSTFSQL